ncbi:hypothetical protein ADL19_23015 [Streptomyces purpurogeneiscleroticus]|nr:hypothetical protein ADL19_23015 [Streptomyces purpurogeneiscleroticus]
MPSYQREIQILDRAFQGAGQVEQPFATCLDVLGSGAERLAARVGSGQIRMQPGALIRAMRSDRQ